MFHLLAYDNATLNSATLTDMTAANDEGFTIRNNHYLLADPFVVFAAWANGATLARARLNVPSLNAIGHHNLWPLQLSATITSPPRIIDYWDSPITLPPNEEIAVESSNSAGGAEDTTVFLACGLVKPNRGIPQGIKRLTLRFTASAAGVASSWGSFANITFEDTLRGGSYAVVGCRVFDAGNRAFRLSFVTQPLVHGRKFHPGWLNVEAVGNMESELWPYRLGEWGRFNSQEPPQIQVWANATGASSQVGMLDVVYLGENMAAGQNA